jgi:putative peptidoglycan lipid II flippase
MKNEKAGRKQSGLLRSTGIVSVFTMLSRVLGLVRDVVVANLFGAGGGADAFFVAFKIPNFFRRLFAEGAFSQAFVPVLSEYRSQRELLEVRLLVSYTAGSLGGVLLLATILCVAFAPAVTYLFAPGFHDLPEKFDLAADMLRITFPYLLLISMTALMGSVLNSYGKFAMPAFTPVLLNVALISAAVLVSPLMDPPILALAWGVMAAGVAQLVFQLPFIKQIDLLTRPRWGWSDPGVKRIMKLMLPALFGVSVAQINLLLDTVLASFLVDGSISWLYYSDRLMELPLGVFGIAIATVILPSLSRKHATQSGQEFSQTLDWAVRMVLLIGLPAALALIALAGPLLVTLFQYGAFSAHDVERASLSLQAYGLGLLGFMLVKVLAPGYFARQDTKTPVKVGIKSMVANMVLNLALIVPFAHVGLALATSLSAALNAGLLWFGLQRDGVYQPQKGWLLFLVRLAVASALMLMSILWLNKDLAQWLVWGWQQRTLHLSLLVVVGMGAYFGALLIMGLRPKDFLTRHAGD